MPREFKTVALWGRLGERSVTEPALQLLTHLRDRGIAVLVSAASDPARALAGATHVAEHEIAERADLVIAIGGDGTLLHAGRHVAARDVPLVGINRGRLGFLTDVSPEHMRDALDAILAGDYLAERRLMLAATTAGADAATGALFALNDIVLQKGDTGRLLDFTTEVDGVYVNTHRGDGLIVATPTGSTAYALSCGGPIIQPNVDALVMVPICPHTLSDRPLVLPSSSEIRVTLDNAGGSDTHVVCDGESLLRMAVGDVLTISLAKQSVTLLHPREYNYYELLRSKLNWGRANRDRPNGGR
jgi:NAD+ kinase